MTSSQIAALAMPLVGTAFLAATAFLVKALFIRKPKAKAEKVADNSLLPVIMPGSPEAKIVSAIAGMNWLGAEAMILEIDRGGKDHSPQVRSIKRAEAGQTTGPHNLKASDLVSPQLATVSFSTTNTQKPETNRSAQFRSIETKPKFNSLSNRY